MKTGSILVVGAGNMGEALIKGICGSRGAKAVSFYETRKDRAKLITSKYKVKSRADLPSALRDSSMIIMAVKPKDLLKLAGEVSAQAGVMKDKILISVAAGIKISAIKEAVGPGARIVRIMPNTPALVGKGVFAAAYSSEVRNADKKAVAAVFSVSGTYVEVEEKNMDAVTALSGSGPAFVFMFMDALIKGGVRAGLPAALAKKLAIETVAGSAALFKESGRSVSDLIESVASPGGTTIEGIYALEKGSFTGTVCEAVNNAYRKSVELGK